MKNFKQYGLIVIVLILFGTNIFIFETEGKTSQDKLTLAMLDVGQGDAIFIESPNKKQILIDGGPRNKILSQLAQVMPVFDKEIDAIIITNPDADHIGGFLDVLKEYKVKKVLEPGTFNDSQTYMNLKEEIKNKKIPNILAKKGMKLILDDGVILYILFPDQDVSQDVSKWSPNDGSVVSRLVYKKTSALLTGDATIRTEKILIKNNVPKKLKSDVLKVGHHGSHTSTSKEFVSIVQPKFALISSGKNNRYNHPNQDVLNVLSEIGATILRTDLLGAIIMKSDGNNFVVEQ